MSEMRASRKPSSSKTSLAASTNRARVRAPFCERGVFGLPLAVAGTPDSFRGRLQPRKTCPQGNAGHRACPVIGVRVTAAAGHDGAQGQTFWADVEVDSIGGSWSSPQVLAGRVP